MKKGSLSITFLPTHHPRTQAREAEGERKGGKSGAVISVLSETNGLPVVVEQTMLVTVTADAASGEKRSRGCLWRQFFRRRRCRQISLP